MKKSDLLLAVLVILVPPLVIWVFYTGRFNVLAGALIDDAWNTIKGILSPIFRR